jgi:hypothetical protein
MTHIWNDINRIVFSPDTVYKNDIVTILGLCLCFRDSTRVDVLIFIKVLTILNAWHQQNWNTIGESAVVQENYPGYWLRPFFPAALNKKVK